MKDSIIFSYYKQLVPFIHEILGEDSEILLHDISSPDSSIVALSGNLSNRKIGGPLTDMALKQIKDKQYLKNHYSTNYKSYTTDGKLCRSSSYFIKDENDTFVGMLCINVLVSNLVEMRDTLDKMIKLDSVMSVKTEETDEHEKLGQSIEELMTSLIDSVLDRYDEEHIKELKISEKEAIITELSDKGVFLLKGGVAGVAKRLEMSEPSVYRYISKVK